MRQQRRSPAADECLRSGISSGSRAVGLRPGRISDLSNAKVFAAEKFNRQSIQILVRKYQL